MRPIKQLIYGIGYFLALASVAGLFYITFFGGSSSCFDAKQNQDETGVDCGGGCISCALKNAQALIVGEPILFSGDRVYSVATEIENTNEVGISSFNYRVDFLDGTGRAFETIENSSFIYPHEKKYLVEAGVRIVTGVPARAKFVIDPATVVLDLAFTTPFENIVRNVQTALEENTAVVSGTVTNQLSDRIRRIGISAFIIGTEQEMLGVSKTEIRNLNPFEERDFKIFVPIDPLQREKVQLDATKVMPEISR